MTEQNQIILTWQGNSLFMGKVCVGEIRLQDNDWYIGYPSSADGEMEGGFYERSLKLITVTAYEWEAKQTAESFIRDQMKTQS